MRSSHQVRRPPPPPCPQFPEVPRSALSPSIVDSLLILIEKELSPDRSRLKAHLFSIYPDWLHPPLELPSFRTKICCRNRRLQVDRGLGSLSTLCADLCLRFRSHLSRSLQRSAQESRSAGEAITSPFLVAKTLHHPEVNLPLQVQSPLPPQRKKHQEASSVNSSLAKRRSPTHQCHPSSNRKKSSWKRIPGRKSPRGKPSS